MYTSLSLFGEYMILYTSTKSQVKAKSQTKAEKAEYAAWCRKVGIDPNKKKPMISKPGKYVPPKVFRRETPNYPSHDSGIGVAAKKDATQYTGDKVMGISIVHKSCLQPVFSGEQAKDFASMRR
jgi:hypothetical protein